MTTLILQITDWDSHFENAASRKLKRLDWVAIPNKTDGEGYTALVDHPNAAAHLGAWYAIVEAASKQNPRGRLPGGIPQDVGGICRSLGRMSRLPASIFEEVIPRLIEIGWLSQVQSNQQSSTVVAESANVVAESASTSADCGVTGNNRELQGRESQGSARAAISGSDRWRRDEQFARFASDYLGTGAALIDADFAEAYEFCWRTLDFSQKLERIAALNRHAEEYHADPRFVPNPRKFLDLEWERPVKPKPRARDNGYKPTAPIPIPIPDKAEVRRALESIARDDPDPEARKYAEEKLKCS